MRARSAVTLLAAGAALWACRAGERRDALAHDSGTSSAAAATAPLASYETVIAPILAGRCVACHGERKQKGGLRLDSREALLAGGESGPVLAGGKEASELLRRVRLPIDDPDHMPPDDKTQPTERELGALEAWIAAGAPLEGRVAALEPFASEPAARAEVVETIPEAPRHAVEALRRALVHVEPVEPGSNGLRLDFAAVASAANDAFVLELLAPARESLVDVSLARAPLGANSIEALAALPRLRRLDLRGCRLDGATLLPLSRAPKLEELVLAGNRLDESSAASLVSAPSLKRAYVWSCGLAPEALARLRAGRPAVGIDAGDAPLAAELEVEPEPKMSKPAPSAEVAAAAPINTTCPVSGSPVDPRHVIEHEGRRIGFCCPDCPAKFLANPASFASKLP